MQLTIHAISKLALSALATGCVLVLSGCDIFSANVHSTQTPTPIDTSVPSPTQMAVDPTNTNMPTIPDGTLKLRYSSGAVVHEGTLTMNGDSGKLLTSFFDINSNQTATVEQTIKLENTSRGLVLWGYNPVYPGTQIPFPNYAPDNFLLGVNPDGSINLRTCDDADNCSDVEVMNS